MSLSWSPAEQGELDHQDQTEKGLRICCLWWRRCMCIYPLAPTWLVRVCSIRSSLPYTYWLAPPLERIGALCRFSLEGDGKQEMPTSWEQVPPGTTTRIDWVNRSWNEQEDQVSVKWVKKESNPFHRETTMAQGLEEKHLMKEDLPH